MKVYVIVSSFSSYSRGRSGAIYCHWQLICLDALCWSKLCGFSVELLSISQFVLFANRTVPSGCRQRHVGFGFSWSVYVPGPLRALCRSIWEISLWLGVFLTDLASPDGELSETRSCREGDQFWAVPPGICTELLLLCFPVYQTDGMSLLTYHYYCLMYCYLLAGQKI